MRCDEAKRLFDAYLDGELSGALATELGAHRLRCASCRRDLALLEVSGHIIGSDRDAVTVREDFTDRLLACVDVRGARWRERFRRVLYIGGPLAAAALIALAFLGFFDGRGKSRVAGLRVEPRTVAKAPALARQVEDPPLVVNGGDGALDEWIQQAQQNLAAKRESGESLQQMFDLTILQMLQILEEARDRYPPDVHAPGADDVESEDPDDTDVGEDEDLEDL